MLSIVVQIYIGGIYLFCFSTHKLSFHPVLQMIKVIGTFEHDSFPTHQSSLHTKLRELIFFKDYYFNLISPTFSDATSQTVRVVEEVTLNFGT